MWPPPEVLAAAHAGRLDLAAFLERHVAVVRDVARGAWDAFAGRDEDWDSLRAYAAAHHVAPFLLGRTEAAGRGDLFPAAWLDGLRAEVARRGERAARLPLALAESVDALAAAGVPCLVLKGLPFAVQVFGDAALRRSLDVDLLVREADADRALQALVARGFRPKRRRTRGAGDGLRIRRRLLRTEHALGLHDGTVSLDLHWRLRTAPAYRWDEDALWRGAGEVRVGGCTYRVPSDECTLVLLLLGLAHDVGRRGCRIKHVLDVDRLLRRAGDGFDWPAFLERRRGENTLSVVVNALDLVRAVFTAPGELASLERALEPHAALRVACGAGDALLLVHGLGGARFHARWFLRAYPVKWARDALWMIDRKVAGFRSLPLLLWRAGAAGYWALRNASHRPGRS